MTHLSWSMYIAKIMSGYLDKFDNDILVYSLNSSLLTNSNVIFFEYIKDKKIIFILKNHVPTIQLYICKCIYL